MVTPPFGAIAQLAPAGTPPSSPSCRRASRRAESQLSASTTTLRAICWVGGVSPR
jgi:hypothetical protein